MGAGPVRPRATKPVRRKAPAKVKTFTLNVVNAGGLAYDFGLLTRAAQPLMAAGDTLTVTIEKPEAVMHGPQVIGFLWKGEFFQVHRP